MKKNNRLLPDWKDSGWLATSKQNDEMCAILMLTLVCGVQGKCIPNSIHWTYI